VLRVIVCKEKEGLRIKKEKKKEREK